MADSFERVFNGPWVASYNGGHASSPRETRAVVVRQSPHSREDVYVEAGCQTGYLHATTAFGLIRALAEWLEGVTPGMVLKAVPMVMVATSPRNTTHSFGANADIHAVGSKWSAIDKDTGEVLSGPHEVAGWKFKFMPDPAYEALNKFLKEGGSSGTQAG